MSQNSTHLLGLVCSFWLSVYLSFSQNTSLHLDKHAWHLFWNAASMYQCMDVPLTPEIGCLFMWCARQWKFLMNQTYFPHSSNRVRMSCVWKQNCVAVEWETDNSTSTHVVSLLVIWKAGHLYFETGAWWHIPDDRPSCVFPHFSGDHITKWYNFHYKKHVQIYCLTVQLYRSSGILKLCCNQAKFTK